MKYYILSLGLLISCSAQSMLQRTLKFPTDDGKVASVVYIFDSAMVARQIAKLNKMPDLSVYEPTPEDLLKAQNAHKQVCIESKQEYKPLSDQEAKELFQKSVADHLLDTLQQSNLLVYYLMILKLERKTSKNIARSKNNN